MTNHITFSIDEGTGDVRFLVNDLSQGFVTEDCIINRASHVEPLNLVLRLVFRAIRFLFNDESKAAAFTRKWPCNWIVNLSPVGGPVVGTFDSREDAIDYEIEWLEENFL